MVIPAKRLKTLIGKFARTRVLVIGDLMLDEFIWGKVARISPEAPVPVVEVQRGEFYPGGAANVGRNLRSFTKHLSICGLIGSDEAGGHLRRLLAKEGISVQGVIVGRKRQTTHKSRIIARQQQVVRVDRETRRKPSPVERALLEKYLRAQISKHDAVLIEDYGKGLLDQALVDFILQQARRGKKIVTVDPNPHNPLQWSGATAVKPNRQEAFGAAGLIPDESNASLQRAAAVLRSKWATRYLLVTLGEQGMLLWEEGKKPYHTPTRAREIFDVSGAGDTAIAVFTLALCAGAHGWEAAELANHAAGVVVGKLGTATLSPTELQASFQTARSA